MRHRTIVTVATVGLALLLPLSCRTDPVPGSDAGLDASDASESDGSDAFVEASDSSPDVRDATADASDTSFDATSEDAGDGGVVPWASVSAGTDHTCARKANGAR